MFATDKLVEIAAGSLSVEVGGTCQTSGAIGNGFIAGQLNRLVDPIAGVVKVANTGTTLGGAEVEKDDPYRERVQMSPEKATTAGPEGQYISFAKSVHQDIVDIAVDSPTPGKVDIIALMRNGELPDAEIILAIISRVSPKDVRPLTDNTEALAPEVVNYEIKLDYWIGSSNSTLAASIQKAVDEAVDNYVLWQKSKLGRDVNPTKLTSMLEQAGATKVSITHPQDIAVSRRQVAILNTEKPAVNYKGLKDD